MTYLVVRLSTLGSVAMLMPVMASVAAAHPKDLFVVVSQTNLAEVFAQLPNVIFRTSDKKSVMSLYNLCKELRKEYKFDGLIDLQDSARSKLIRRYFRLFGVRYTVIHKERNKRRQLIKNGYTQSQPLQTEFMLYQNTFLAAGLSVEQLEFSPLNPIQDADTRQIVGQKNKGEQWIGVAPFATHTTNMLPYKLTKGLLAYLSNRPNTKVFLFGSGEIECEMLGQWASIYDNVTTVAGRVSIMNELAVMTQLDIMVGMDSANQHLSSLVGLPAMTIWCGTHPYAGFYGWKQNPTFIVQKELSCRPCTLHGADICKKNNFECKNIDTNEIIEKLEWCLNQLIK